MTEPRKKRSKQSQTDEKSERAIARERHGHDDRQADRPAARSRKSTSARASPDRRAGEQVEASRPRQAGERGQDERKRKMKGHGGHEHLIISSSHHPPSPHQARTASRDKSPPQPYRIGAVPVPVAILFEAAGTVRATEARQIDHGIAQHPKHGHAHAAADNDITRQASSPVGSPSPDTKRRGEETRRRGANRE